MATGSASAQEQLVDPDDLDQIRELGQRLRIDSVRASSAAGSGHPTSSMSAADLMAVLIARHLHYDFDDPANPLGDHLIFSKGHASPLLYAIYRATGAVSDEELLTFRHFESRLEGHPTPALPWVDVATGSLGQGLPIGVGIGLAGKRLDQLPYRVWVLCGDSELAEGSIWEAFDHASYQQLDNVVAILDINRLGQRGETMHGWDLNLYADRARSFGWHAIEVDGHDVAAIDDAYAEAVATEGKPVAIIAKTIKGKGVKALEDHNGFHGKPVPDEDEALSELGDIPPMRVNVHAPEGDREPHRFETPGGELPTYEIDDDPVATRQAYGDAITALAKTRSDVVALDGEVSNSTHADEFKDAAPDRFFEMFIAEQQMIATAVGFQVRKWVPFASTFAAFLSRAYDFVRMAAISKADIRLCGSHAGVAIGEDGPSQMALEDLASLRAITSSCVLYPCDPNQTAKLVERMADRDGISYMRTSRGATPTIYGADERFEIGGSHVVRSSDSDEVTLIGAGVTLHEAVEAADKLAEDGISARVIDLYSVKPVDVQTLHEAAAATGGRLVTAEDHRPEGGIGDAVLDAFADSDEPTRVIKLAVHELPGSGKPAELLAQAKIDADAIVDAARELVKR